MEIDKNSKHITISSIRIKNILYLLVSIALLMSLVSGCSNPDANNTNTPTSSDVSVETNASADEDLARTLLNGQYNRVGDERYLVFSNESPQVFRKGSYKEFNADGTIYTVNSIEFTGNSNDKHRKQYCLPLTPCLLTIPPFTCFKLIWYFLLKWGSVS